MNPNIVPEFSLGDRLRKAREVAGFEQIQFADVIGVHRDSIRSYERGRTTPRPIVLRAWAMSTGVALEWLETGEAPGRVTRGSELPDLDSNQEPAG